MTSSPEKQTHPGGVNMENGATDAKRRPKSKELPCFVVEDHHEVIPCLYRLMGAKKIPLQGNLMIHFDSHPDMLVPKNMKAESVWEKEALFEALSIENWIIPACFAGHFTKLVWVKPPWAHQMPDGEFKFRVGSDLETGEIRLSSNLSYFVSESLFCRPERLEDSKEMTLVVLTLGESVLDPEKSDLDSSEALHPRGVSYVLDVDLDFFSTRNPFKVLYKNAQLYEQLKDLYWFLPPNSTDSGVLEDAAAARREQITDLERLWKYVEDSGVSGDPSPPSERWPVVKKIAQNVMDVYSEVDWTIVHDAGCTWDNTDLPEHVSSKTELEGLLDVFKNVVSSLPEPPGAITISRSSEDDYCPIEDVEYIQEEVLKILKEKWTNVSVHEVYLNS